MPFVKYTTAEKSEAVVIATAIGLTAAAESLDIPEKTLAEWLRKAGRAPADAIEPASFQRVATIALAKAERLVAEGKLSAAQLLNAATMATKQVDKPASADSAIAARDAYFDWVCDDVITGADLDDFDAAADAVDRLKGYLLDRANAEDVVAPETRPRARPILAWYSGDPETEAGDVLDWAKAHTQALVARHGSLVAWRALELRREERERVIRARAEALVRDGGMRSHEAVPFVREHLIDDYPEVTDAA